MAMKHILSSILIITVLTLHANVVERYYFTSAGKATFKSDAPLELISATSEAVTGILDPVNRTFAFKIPVSSFSGFNCELQRDHFNEKYMQSDKYQYATFTGNLPPDYNELKKGMQALKAFGILKIHGVQKERTIPVNLFMADQVLVIRSSFNVLLEDHNIDVPKVLYSKIASEVNIEVNALMRIRFGKIDPASASIN